MGGGDELLGPPAFFSFSSATTRKRLARRAFQLPRSFASTEPHRGTHVGVVRGSTLTETKKGARKASQKAQEDRDDFKRAWRKKKKKGSPPVELACFSDASSSRFPPSSLSQDSIIPTLCTARHSKKETKNSLAWLVC